MIWAWKLLAPEPELFRIVLCAGAGARVSAAAAALGGVRVPILPLRSVAVSQCWAFLEQGLQLLRGQQGQEACIVSEATMETYGLRNRKVSAPRKSPLDKLRSPSLPATLPRVSVPRIMPTHESLVRSIVTFWSRSRALL